MVTNRKQFDYSIYRRENNYEITSRELPIQEMIKVKGQDMQEEYTITSVCGSKLKFIVENRMSDDRLRIIVNRIEGEIEFELEDLQTGLMPLEWKKGQPIAKLLGTTTAYNTPNGCIILQQPINVFIKKVEQFTDNPDQLKKDPYTRVYECD